MCSNTSPGPHQAHVYLKSPSQQEKQALVKNKQKSKQSDLIYSILCSFRTVTRRYLTLCMEGTGIDLPREEQHVLELSFSEQNLSGVES